MRRFMICFCLAGLLACAPATLAMASPGPGAAITTLWGGFADALDGVLHALQSVFHKDDGDDENPPQDPPPADPESDPDTDTGEDENGPSMDPNGGS